MSLRFAPLPEGFSLVVFGFMLLGCSRDGLQSSASVAAAGGAGHPDACDADGDGHQAVVCGGDDCDDTDPARHPGALDVNVRAGPWVIEQASAGVDGDLRATPSLVVDTSAAAHLSYVLAGLTYATNASGTWVEQPVDPEADGPSSLKLDPAGAAHIAYRTFSGLRYATNAGGSWAMTTIDPEGDGACSLALDGFARMYVVYGAGNARRIAEKGSGPWGFGDLGPMDNLSPSLTVMGPGPLFLSYGGSALFYATSSEHGWGGDIVAQGTQLATSLALGPDGFPHIGYIDAGARHATLKDGMWVTEMVSDSAEPFTVSLGVDAAGAVHMAYDALGTHYATNKSGTWQDENLFIGWSGGVALALDSGGAVHIADSDFQFSQGTFINYATNRLVEADGVDQNCDGVDGVDADGDGHASRATGGDDCNDEMPGGLCGGG